MNKQKSKAGIQWARFSWNPSTGCLNTCEYCYARKIAMRFQGNFFPAFHEGRLKQPYAINEPSRIFVCSMGELFGSWVPKEWQNQIIKVVKDNPQHTFQFLTKYPAGYKGLEFPKNAWLGFTPTDKMTIADAMDFNSAGNGNIRFLSIEPLMSNVEPANLHLIKKPDWIIVGGMTPKPVHEQSWVDSIVDMCRKNKIPLFLKSNLHHPVSVEQFPEVGTEINAKGGQ